MLGTGIASAQENVNPDAPPSTIDGGIQVPIDIAHTAFGAAEGQNEAAEFNRDAPSARTTSTNPLIRNSAERADANHTTRSTPATPYASPYTGDQTWTGEQTWTETSGAPIALAQQAPAEESTLLGHLAGVPVGLPVPGEQIATSVVAPALAEHGDDVIAVADTRSDEVPLGADAVAAQTIDDAAGHVGNPINDTALVDGGLSETTGHLGSISGSLVDVPASDPVHQGFDNATIGADNGFSNVDSALDSTSHDDQDDVLTVPEAWTVEVFGEPIGEYGSIADERAAVPDLAETTPLAGPVEVIGEAVTATANGDTGDLGGTRSDGTPLDGAAAETPAVSGGVTTQEVPLSAESTVRSYDVSDEVLGSALSNVYTKAPQLTAEETEAANLARGVQIPKSIDSLLTSTELPGLSGLNRLPIQRDTLAPRNLQDAEVPELPTFVIPHTAMRGGVLVPADVVGDALRTSPVDAVQLSAEETEAANLARGVQIPKSIDSLLTSTEVPNLTAFEVPRIPEPQLPEARPFDNTPSLGGAPVPVRQSAQQVADGVHTVNTADVSLPVGPEVNGGGVAMTDERLPVHPQYAVDRGTDAAGLSKMTLPKGSYFDKVSDTSGSDTAGQAERAVNTLSDTVASAPLPVPHQHVNLTEERSFSGSLPAGGDAGFGAAPVVKSLVPLGTGRNLTSLPTLPVSAPSAPAVLPVLPVSQPRAMADGVPLSDIKLNPTSSYVDVPALPSRAGRSHPAPALAGLDTRTMFGSLEDTIQFERIK
ncbi:hypothetical protein [Umezawaea sp.]|uniref:hypothetical protein n=1 Tax=Umezawaea sp. TaxID=1955258 RepID=UPI002ED654DA